MGDGIIGDSNMNELTSDEISFLERLDLLVSEIAFLGELEEVEHSITEGEIYEQTRQTNTE